MFLQLYFPLTQASQIMNRPIFAFSAPNVVAQKPLSREPLPSLQILTNDNRAFNVNPSFAHRASINSQPQSPGTTSRRKGSPVRSPTRESFPLSALEPIQVLSPSSALSSVRLDFFQLFMQSPVEMLSQNTLELEGLRILERKIREAEEYGKTLKLNPLLLKPLQRVRPSRKSLTSQERSASPVPVSAQDGENCTSQKDRNDRNNFGGRKRPSSPSKKTDGKKDRDQIKNGRYHPYREDYVPTTNSSSISTIENLKEAARGTSNSRKTPLTQTYNLDDLPVRKPKAIVIKANSKSPTAYEGTAIRLDDGQSLEPLPIERYNNTKGAPPIVWKGLFFSFLDAVPTGFKFYGAEFLLTHIF